MREGPMDPGSDRWTLADQLASVGLPAQEVGFVTSAEKGGIRVEATEQGGGVFDLVVVGPGGLAPFGTGWSFVRTVGLFLAVFG